MAEYKVIQDIEAEDKLLGPLTLRQFIYASIVVAHLGLIYVLAQSAPILIPLFVPSMIFFGALAAPLGGAQSSEVWLLAKIRFFIKPRNRVWSQDGLQELVTITVPKKVEKHLTDNLSRVEVKSRLTALANTLDSRGWAIKHAYSPPMYGASQASDDRLLDTQNAFEIEAVDQTVDVMDESHSDVARQFQDLIQQSTTAHREAVLQTVQNPQSTSNQPADYWFMSGQTGGQQTNYQQKTIIPGTDDDATSSNADDSGRDEQAFLEKRHKEEAQPDPGYSHLKTLQPIDKQAKSKSTQKHHKTEPKQTPAVTKNPDIMRLASNDDLNVSTIAREANRAVQGDDGEVVISLH